MMGDAIDAGMDTADDEEAANGIYSQICDEIGIQLGEETEVNNRKINTGSQPVKVSIVLFMIFSKKMICRLDWMLLNDDRSTIHLNRNIIKD